METISRKTTLPPKEVLGHANLKTTEIYTHVSTSMVRKIKSPISYLTIT